MAEVQNSHVDENSKVAETVREGSLTRCRDRPFSIALHGKMVMFNVPHLPILVPLIVEQVPVLPAYHTAATTRGHTHGTSQHARGWFCCYIPRHFHILISMARANVDCYPPLPRDTAINTDPGCSCRLHQGKNSFVSVVSIVFLSRPPYLRSMTTGLT